MEKGIEITSWNLQWFPGFKPGTASKAERDSHIAKVVEVLKTIDPDMLCLQEAKEPAALTELANELPGYPLQVISSFKGTQEAPILSRHKADAAFMEKFTPAEATPPRDFAYAAFRFDDYVLALYTAHLKSNSGGITETAPKREESARQMLGKRRPARRSLEGYFSSTR